MYEAFAKARTTELAVFERKINQRMEWAHVSRIEKLERALRSARGKMQFTANFSLKAN